jgi:hypothetical protein
MQTTLEFGISAFDCNICIENLCPELHDALERYILPPLPRNRVPSSSRDVLISIDRVAGRYRLAIDGIEATSSPNVSELILATLKAIDDAVIYRLQTLKAVHAGAVVFQSQAILFPGVTHAGKSSLVAELLRRGARLLSDEYALIDKAGRVHSYPRPIMLRDSRHMQSPVLPGEFGSQFTTGPVPVGWIMALEYWPESIWEVRDVPQGEALMILLRNTPHPMADSPEMISSFMNAVSSARCLTGYRGHVAQSADQILKLISGL